MTISRKLKRRLNRTRTVTPSIKTAQYGLLLTVALLAGGCCLAVQSDPAPPNSVRGWHEFDAQGIHGVGEFVLKNGQPIENGDIGIELIKTVAPVKCYEPFAERDLFPKAVVRFYSRVVRVVENDR